jgi:hypothetical protein
MASTIDIWLDKSGGIVAGGSAQFASLPALTRNDQYPIRLRIVERNDSGLYTDATLVSPSLKLGIGNLGDLPTSGEFKLTSNGTTSSAISYNATTTQVFNAISGIVGNVSVTGYGTNGSAWIITAATANTALSMGGSSFTLFPDSSVLINTRRFPSSNIFAEQVVELARSPAAFTDSFTATSGDFTTLNKIQDGSSTQNETYELLIGNDVLGGSFALSFNGYSIAADYNVSAVTLNTLLTAITGIGTNNLSVQPNSKRGYIITFVNDLGLQNVITPLVYDSSGIVGTRFYESVVTLSTVQIDNLFIESNSNEIAPTIEISLLESGKEKTLFQSGVTIRKDLINTGAAIPAAQAGYYTKAEVDSSFVPNTNTNVDSTNRVLYGASSQKSVDYGNRSLTDSANTSQFQWGSTGVTVAGVLYAGGNISAASVAGTKIGTTTSQKLAFFGNTPVVQPTNPNVVSCLGQLGLFKDAATTYGIFPNSPRTLTTTASLWFNGNIASNDYHSVTVSVTGAAVNDVVLFGLPSSLDNGLILKGCAVASNVVSITALNATNGGINQVTATYRITVIGY